MSRVGKQPIKIPSGVTVSLTNHVLEVKGPKGTLTQNTFGRVAIEQKASEVSVSSIAAENKSVYWGLYRALLANMVKGVSEGFTKALEIQGTGYRANLSGKALNLSVGYSHPVSIDPPQGITFTVEKTGNVVVSGASKELVGQMAAKIRDIRPVEPYQGKGIRYVGETVVKKVGKSAAKK